MRNSRRLKTELSPGRMGDFGRPAFLALSVLMVFAFGAMAARAAAAPHIFQSAFGTFSGPESLAVDPASHAIYVFDKGSNSIDRFDAAGNPEVFSASQPYVSGNALTGTSEGSFAFLGGDSEAQIAVAPFGSPAGTAGDIYVTETGANAIDVFDSTGTYLGRITEAAGSAFGEACGVTVDPSGAIYVGDFNGAIDRYIATTNPPTNADFDSQITGVGGICNLASDGSSVYASTWSSGPLTAYPVSQFPGGGGSSDASASGVAIEDGGSAVTSNAVYVDPATGDLYVDEGAEVAVYDSSGSLIEHFGSDHELSGSRGIAVDGTVAYVADTTGGEVDVFGPPPPPSAPAISETTASGMTTSEAVLEAEINPDGDASSYHFEYVDDASFQIGGYALATRVPIPDVGVGAGFKDVHVAQPVFGLLPATRYHFRVVAGNSIDVTEGPGQSFSTYPSLTAEACTNEASRTGPSAALPDCRAYELVTPADTNGTIPAAAAIGGLNVGNFPTELGSAVSDSVVYLTVGGALPGAEGNGNNDMYEALRGVDGWESHAIGPTGVEAVLPSPGGVSPDHGLSIWGTGPGGGGLISDANYVRDSSGDFELVGHGSLADDPSAQARWITANGSHLIFTSGREGETDGVQLEPAAPLAPLRAIYDRTPGGLFVVSLLPGNVTPSEDANYLGASSDGSSVVFSVGSAIYERRDNAATLKVTDGPAGFAGVSQNGDKVFYLENEKLFVFDAGSGESTGVIETGNPELVNISPDGSHVYFVSNAVLSGGEENDQGSSAEVGAENLYAWDAGSSATRFIGALDPSDVSGEGFETPGVEVGLTEWLSQNVNPNPSQVVGPANNPSRTTANGSVLVFQSHASLTKYDSGGHSEIYRYDAVSHALGCVSCSPIELPASSGARLESPKSSTSPVNALTVIHNVSDDGGRVFFETAESLTPRDVDGSTDVYEWRAGKGLFLISSGRSGPDVPIGAASRANYLYSATPDGDDVFIITKDALVPEAGDGGVPAIYDARVGGGFPGGSVEPCSGDACQAGSSAPALSGVASAELRGPGNVKRHHRRKHRKKPHHKRGHHGKQRHGSRTRG